MLTRSQLSPLPPYFDRYINKVDDVTVLQALDISAKELEDAPLKEWKRIGNKVYAPGKWTINDIIQHITDCERVFAYRAVAFARGEKDVKSFDENLYAQNAQAVNRTLEDLLEELKTVRKSSLLLYKSFNGTMLNRVGVGVKGEYSVHDLGFIIAGHQRWHFEIIKERYLGL